MSTKFILLESINLLDNGPQYQFLIGILVCIWLIWIISKFGENKDSTMNTEQIQAKLSEWNPDSLVREIESSHISLKPKLVTSRIAKTLIVDGKNCLNMATHNYLGLLQDQRIMERAISATRKYGIGSCGPRGFYGTVDVHLELEERIAQFMEAEEAIVYSYGFSTVASAISAYCKRRDIIFADEKVNFAIQKGFEASRSTVKYFRHNDVNNLEMLLIEQAKIDALNHKNSNTKTASGFKRARKFLIIEGIYVNTGKMCPLPELVVLCEKYKVRIFIDESISFGTLGNSGKGVTEYFGVPGYKIDMIMGSLEWAIGSIGGFCVGSSFVIEHQRLSGLGYCFSASLPPLLTAAAITAIDIIEQEASVLLPKLKQNCIDLQNYLNKLKHFELSASPQSPVKHLFLRIKQDRHIEFQLLKRISEKCINENLAIMTSVYLDTENQLPRPSLRLCVSSAFDQSDLLFAVEILEKSYRQILSS